MSIDTTVLAQMVSSLGYNSKEELQSRSLSELILISQGESPETLKEKLSKGKVPLATEVVFQKKNGDSFSKSVHGFHFECESGESHIGWIENYPENSNAQKNDLEKEFHDYQYAVSHDLRAPLRGISSFARFALEDFGDVVDTELKQHLLRISGSSENLKNRIEALLCMSRITTKPLLVEATPIEEIIKNAVLNLKKEHPNLDISYGSDLPTLQTDRSHLEEIFSELLLNSVTFNNNDKKEITVSWEETPDSSHLFKLKDNGIGLNQKHWERIFKFFNTVGKISPKEDSTGSGLALVKKRLQRLGGDISIENSNIGEGTTFAFTFKERA